MKLLQHIKNTPTQIRDYINQTKEMLEKKKEQIALFEQRLFMFESEFQKLEGMNQEQEEDEIFNLDNQGTEHDLLEKTLSKDN